MKFKVATAPLKIYMNWTIMSIFLIHVAACGDGEVSSHEVVSAHDVGFDILSTKDEFNEFLVSIDQSYSEYFSDYFRSGKGPRFCMILGCFPGMPQMSGDFFEKHKDILEGGDIHCLGSGDEIAYVILVERNGWVMTRSNKDNAVDIPKYIKDAGQRLVYADDDWTVYWYEVIDFK